MLPTTDAMRSASARLVSAERILFPVRHHSPACSLQLARLLRRVKPAAILIEGPRGFTPLIPLLAHTEAQFPLAIYTYHVEKAPAGTQPRRRAAYYPFCEYSPELVALRTAQALGVPASFMDLDFAEQCRLEPADEEEEQRSLLEERHLQRSRYLLALAQKLGCRDHEELWEHLFEGTAAARELDEHFANLYTYCRLARTDCSEAELTADGTLAREAEMAWHLGEAIAKRAAGDGPVIAVMGGFHAVVMADLLEARPARPSTGGSAIAEERATLIRYGYERLDRLNGYSAGMTSPAWHQRVWELTQKHEAAGLAAGPRARQEAALGLLFDVAAELRGRHGLALPTPTLGAAFEHTLRLANLRARAAPIREDVLDAITSCFIKGEVDGDGALIQSVTRRLLSGQAMGKLPPGTLVPPLVKDFEYRARRQRLKIDDSEPRRAVLDIYRRPEHRITSRLLHGLSFLGVPLGVRTAGPDFVQGSGLDRLQEHWEYTYSAATEAALVEASLYGSTVPSAVANKFARVLEQQEAAGRASDARAAAGLLVQACVLGLHDHLARVAGLLTATVGADASFESVAEAASIVGLLWESREPLEARGAPELPPILKAAYERAIYLGRSLPNVASDGRELLAALSCLRELLVSEAGGPLDGTLYWAMLESLYHHHAQALVRGACAGLRYSGGRLGDAELAQALEGHLGGLVATSEAVGFLRGLLNTAREAAWQQPALLTTLDRLLASWVDEDFVRSLPELRLAFAEMTPKETDRIASSVAELHGLTDLGRLVHYDVSAAQVQQHLALSEQLKQQLAADGLGGWLAP
ncbi:MAG TPA: DUF5682 family protein [Steroidobacteraceae bacterium]|nr:DUF5682 family protein [Steroidobacteraceae bacterium]